jgi:type III secretory pathway component EscV
MGYRIELGGALRVSDRLDAFASAIGEAIRPCIAELGIPVRAARPNVIQSSAEQIVRVLFNERYRAPSRALLLAAWQETGARRLQQESVSRNFQEWLGQLTANFKDQTDAAVELVASVAAKIVRRHPEELFGEDEADLWLQTANFRGLAPAHLVKILRPVLRARISLQERTDTIAKLLTEELSRRTEHAEIAETLITKLAPSARFRVEVRASPALDETQADQAMKRTADRVLFRRLGIRMTPELNKAAKNAAEADGAATFQIFLNDQSQGVFAGIPDDHVLVKVPPEELPHKVIKWRGWIMPDGSEASVVPAKFVGNLDEAQLDTQNPLEYMADRAAEEACRCASFLVTAHAAELELARVAQYCPDLALAAARQLRPTQLAAILRQLLREGVSIRDLVTILERLVGFERVVVDEFECEVYDDRLPVHPKLANLASPLLDHYERVRHVRRGLQRAIGYAQSRGAINIRALTLDQSIEMALLDHLAAVHGHPEATRLDDAELYQVTAAIGKAIDRYSLGAQPPALLAAGSIRWFVHDLMADEFPNLSVIGYDELAVDLAVQRLGRVMLSR